MQIKGLGNIFQPPCCLKFTCKASKILDAQLRLFHICAGLLQNQTVLVDHM